MLVRITLKTPQASDEVFVRRLLDNPAVESVEFVDRVLDLSAHALERAQVGDAMECEMYLEQFVQLDGTYVSADQHNVDTAPNA